jgi:rubrerythrin
MRSFQSLNEQEILALAVTLEEEHARTYDDFAAEVNQNFPAQAEKFREMRRQEDEHRHRLLDIYRSRFGNHVPLILREDVKGFIQRQPIWQLRARGVKGLQKQSELMELEAQRFYEAAARKSNDAGIRQLLGDLAEEERRHVTTVEQMAEAGLSTDEAALEKRLFALQVIQPGLAGLMDGSVSTLAPLFAAAFATHSSTQTFLVGLAASLGAGISMGFAEALSDDGTLTGRGHPWMRGFVCGLMTAIGGLGHTLPYLIGNVQTATFIAAGVVFIELGVISWVRHRFMDTPLSSAFLQVGLGGFLVFLVGMLIGKS